MALTFSGFAPGTAVNLYRPTATPNVGPPPPIATGVTADANGVASFADQPGGHYFAFAVNGSYYVWRFVAPGYDGASPIVPPVWSNVARTGL